MKTKEVQQDPLFRAWRGHLKRFKIVSPHKYVNKGLVDHVRRYHMFKILELGHKLIWNKNPWVHYIPIFMELQGEIKE